MAWKELLKEKRDGKTNLINENTKTQNEETEGKGIEHGYRRDNYNGFGKRGGKFCGNGTQLHAK